jgi:hypothetical protein
LARFFDVSVLRSYCESRLGVTGKGNEATLAVELPVVRSILEPLPLEPLEEKAVLRRRPSRRKVPIP